MGTQNKEVWLEAATRHGQLPEGWLAHQTQTLEPAEGCLGTRGYGRMGQESFILLTLTGPEPQVRASSSSECFL